MALEHAGREDKGRDSIDMISLTHLLDICRDGRLGHIVPIPKVLIDHQYCRRTMMY